MVFYEKEIRNFIESIDNVDMRLKVDFYNALKKTIELGQQIEAESGTKFKGFMMSYLNRFK